MARDPYKYYRIEARELIDGLARGVLQLERGGAGAEPVALLLRLAHTLKGAARVVKQPASAELAHRFESVLEPHRGGSQPQASEIAELLSIVDQLRAELDALDGAPVVATALPTATASITTASASATATSVAASSTASAASEAPPRSTPTTAATERRFQTVRVDIAEMDALLEGLSESVAQVAGLRRHSADLERRRSLLGAIVDQINPSGGRTPTPAAMSRVRLLLAELQQLMQRHQRSLEEGLDRSEAELRQVRDQADALRLLPAGTLFDRLERAARDAALAGGKRIDFVATGGEQKLDGHLLSPLADALMHLVRNAADHGIETPEARRAAGKPETGRIELSVQRRGGRVIFTCSDDGRGLDVEAIRQAALRAGKLTPQQAGALDLQAAVQLLMRGGVSTKQTVSEISGRGIGLDFLRATAEQARASISASSTPGQGTRFEISVPPSLSALSALALEAGGQTLHLPLDAVSRVLRLSERELARTADAETLVHEGEVLPFLPLTAALGGAREPRALWTVLIVESRNGRAGVGVDRLIGRAEVVVRPMPAVVGSVPLISGAVMDAEGVPQPVLDPDGLVDAARARRVLDATGDAAPVPHILVIDDSLTTRTLEQSILESAGYRVSLATSAEEALEMARWERYDLFVVDVEMPGMNGFEFVARTRADDKLRQTPAMLVSSLALDEHKRRGMDAGASAYIVKGEFDQGVFLNTVRRLAG